MTKLKIKKLGAYPICNYPFCTFVKNKNMIQHIGIIGSGAMGSGIAQVAAMSGCKVQLSDMNENALAKAK